jgi:hypothetical protein
MGDTTAREFPRYALAAAVTLRHGDATTEGRTQNVSRGGVCAHVRAAMPLGAVVTVELALIFDEASTSDTLVLQARVVWSTPIDDGHQIGLSFCGLSAEQARYLDVFLRYLADTEPPRQSAESSYNDLFSARRR